MKNLNVTISTNLKLLRQKNGWSLDVASKKTGVSKAMLGQIERGESSPTISILWKIANGFETSFSYFIEDAVANKKSTLYRKSDLIKVHSRDDKIRVTPIFSYDKKLGFEVFIIELLPNSKHLSPPHHGNIIEHVIATYGPMEVLVDSIWHKIKKNEGLRFNANQPHGYRNTSGKKIAFYNIIHYLPS